MTPTLHDRIAGCLLAGALGDAIGARFENELSPRFFVPEKLSMTDDTQLTVATCEAIISSEGVDPESIATRMTQWFRDRRISGIGASTLKSMTELNVGGHWAMVGATGERSAGNGAAMRISPLAFMLDPHDAIDRRTIRDVCGITHRNDEAYLGALAVVYAINRRSLDADLIDDLIGRLPDSRMRDRLIEIRDGKLGVVQLAEKYPTSGYVVDSVPFSILAAVESVDLMETIQLIVECGGDTDTTASMFGNLYGATYGSGVLPMEVVERINDFELISETAALFSQVAGRA